MFCFVLFAFIPVFIMRLYYLLSCRKEGKKRGKREEEREQEVYKLQERKCVSHKEKNWHHFRSLVSKQEMPKII